MSTTCIFCQSFSFDFGMIYCSELLMKLSLHLDIVKIYKYIAVSLYKKRSELLKEISNKTVETAIMPATAQLDHGILEVFRAIVLAADNPVKEIGIILADFGLQEKFISKIVSCLKISFFLFHPFHIFYEGKYAVNSLKEDLKYVYSIKNIINSC